MAVETTVEDDIATVALDRPEKMNAITVDVAKALEQSLKDVAKNSSVVVLTGNGRAFCAGADMDESPIEYGMEFERLEERLTPVQNVIETIRELPRPVVGRINGPAIGAGCDIALATDFRIATHDAMFYEKFVDMGVISGDGGAYLLPRLVGELRAKEMALLGEEIDGKEAEEIGLVNDAVPESELDDVVAEYVERLASKPAPGLYQNKQLLNESFDSTMHKAFKMARYAMWMCLQSDDFHEARESFRK